MRIMLTSLLMFICCFVLNALPKSKTTEVKDSTIINVNKNVRINARNKSLVNTGIQARGATIKNSTLTNRFSGTVDARNHSNVTTGIKADGAVIENSDIDVDTRAHINANSATVKTGVDISGASNADIKTKYRGNISAAGSMVKAGTVEGNIRHKDISTNVTENINARGRGITIGTVTAGNGRASKYMGKKGIGIGPRRAGAAIGNVTSKSSILRKVDTEVGSGNFIKGMKTRHMANFYSETNGVDPSGTKHVFVSRKAKEYAKKRGRAVGNSHITTGDRVRRVDTFVE
jgi:hypothetical protein